MKLNLKEERGVHTLVADGAITEREFEVLNAGVIKLFRDGKNRIILDLNRLDGLTSEHIVQLAKINTVARELSGELALVGLNEKLKSVARSLANPAILKCYADSMEASRELRGEKEESDHADQKELVEAGELDDLKARIRELEEENAAVKTSLENHVAYTRVPAAGEEVQDQLKVLEEKCLELDQQVTKLKKSAK